MLDGVEMKERVTRVQGVPRSVFELHFYANLHACPVCGDHSLLSWRTTGTGRVWWMEAICPRCKTRRVCVFDADPDLVEIEVSDFELGGSSPSTLFTAADLIAECKRLRALLPHSSGDRVDDIELAWKLYDELRTAVNELAKFGDADRVVVDTERAHVAALSDALPRRRFVAPESVSTSASEHRGAFDRQHGEAHSAWLHRGRTGEGRLEMVGVDGRDLKLDGSLLDAAKFDYVDLRGASLNFTHWNEAEITHCEFRTASINSATFERTTLTECSFWGIGAARIKFPGARLSKCTFEKASMGVSTWNDSVVSHSSFVEAKLGNSKWERARVEYCDFRRSTFAPTERLPLTKFRGTVFVACDFRGVDLVGIDLSGARFEQCAFAGAVGEPLASEGLVVVDADFSAAADCSVGGDTAHLLSQLVVRNGAT